MRITITRKMIENASEIRKAAARKWGCKENEILWPLCVGMAMRGESIVMEEIFSVEKIEVQKTLGIFVVEVTPANRSLGEFYNVSVNGKSARLIVDAGQKLLQYDTPIVMGGKKFGAMSLDDTSYQKVLEQIARVRDFIVRTSDQTKVGIYIITNNETWGYTVRVDNGRNMRSDVTEMNDLLKGQGRNREIAEAIQNSTNKDLFQLGDYSSVTTYEVTPEKFSELIVKVREIVEREKAEAERKDRERIAKRNDEINTMSDAEFVKKYMTETIHLDENDGFAETIADEVVSRMVWPKNTPEDVRQDSSYIRVRGRGKEYTYRLVSPESISLLLKRHTGIVEKRKAEVLSTTI